MDCILSHGTTTLFKFLSIQGQQITSPWYVCSLIVQCDEYMWQCEKSNLQHTRFAKISAKEEYQSYGTIFKGSVVILVVVKTILTYEENVWYEYYLL